MLQYSPYLDRLKFLALDLDFPGKTPGGNKGLFPDIKLKRLGGVKNEEHFMFSCVRNFYS